MIKERDYKCRGQSDAGGGEEGRRTERKLYSLGSRKAVGGRSGGKILKIRIPSKRGEKSSSMD